MTQILSCPPFAPVCKATFLVLNCNHNFSSKMILHGQLSDANAIKQQKKIPSHNLSKLTQT